MSNVSLKKYKEKNKITSFIITVVEGKGTRKWKGDYYLTLEEAQQLLLLLKKELRVR